MAQFHEVSWNEQNVKFFWDNVKNMPWYQERYFTNQVGDGILAAVNKIQKIKGEVLDFSAGHGYLTEKLCKNKDLSVTACEFSKDSADFINDKCKSFNNFKGTTVLDGIPCEAYADNSFDYVFFIETIEHLLDDQLSTTISEIRRILKPGGHLAITTPKDENLVESKVLCPECGAYFHKVQHVRSFSKESLSDVMQKLNLKTTFCGGVNFWTYQAPMFSFMWAKSIARTVAIDHPNLLYIGQK